MDDVLDPELAAVAPMIPALDLSDVPGMRALTRQFLDSAVPYEPERPLCVEDLAIPGYRRAPDVRVRVHAPTERTGPLPGLLYLHGGAFVMGDLDSVDNQARLIADRAGVVVVSVDYRLAPENPYPAGLDDCYAAFMWAAGAAGRAHGIDGARVGVLGESAGGGLAAALMLIAKDRGGPVPTAQFLDAPTVDDRLRTHSMRHLPETPTWSASNSPYSWAYYLGDLARPGDPDVPRYAAPARAEVEDLAGLPPAWVAAYQVDPTRDEGLDYARLLIRAGVPTEVHHYSGAFHLAHVIPGTAIGSRMISARTDAIRRLLRAS
ncbi:alpha/beta hydrolase fold domain-containing protein [Streptomyces sp. NPDC008092]|uniref:alpha/beta hydrolase n=1 Tax=Streptomyces sp. NPDC008092 TaxID=3364808 RepID=UPI0036EAC52E